MFGYPNHAFFLPWYQSRSMWPKWQHTIGMSLHELLMNFRMHVTKPHIALGNMAITCKCPCNHFPHGVRRLEKKKKTLLLNNAQVYFLFERSLFTKKFLSTFDGNFLNEIWRLSGSNAVFTKCWSQIFHCQGVSFVL